MIYKELSLEDLNQDELRELFGVDNRNIKELASLFNEEIISRGSILKLSEDIYVEFSLVIDNLIRCIRSNQEINESLIKHIYTSVMAKNDLSWHNKVVMLNHQGKPIKFKTYNQYKFASTLDDNDLVFSIGPAGTGKTFLAVLLACKAYKQGDVKRIVLTRPAVEAGESLGYLPGDLKEKIDPYLMPLYDALYDILGQEQVLKLLEKGLIEIVPLAYMRGRTLDDAFVILDEAQNTSARQMLMFLTRLGYNSKMIVNGDITQIDLNIDTKKSGLVIAKERLQSIKRIGFIEFDKNDIVRNPLVEKIIEKFTI